LHLKRSEEYRIVFPERTETLSIYPERFYWPSISNYTKIKYHFGKKDYFGEM